MHPILRYSAPILALIIGVSGCGFKLRGSTEPLPLEIRQLALDGIAKESDLYRQLARSLTVAGANLNPPVGVEGYATLTIGKIDQRRDDISDSGGESLYRSSLSVTFSLGRGEHRLIASRRLKVSREFSFDSNNPYGLERQDRLIRSELQRDLIRQLIAQIRAAGPVEAPAN